MTYKDPDKQREADRMAKQRQRAAKAQSCTPQGMTKGVIVQGMTVKDEPSNVIPKCAIPNGDTDISTVKALHQLINKAESHRNEGAMPDDYYEKAKQETTHNVTERMYEAHKKCEGMTKPKRGKDIKVFADLPPDVQQTIDNLSMVDGKICQRVKANRTAIAINYQHLFPDRFHSTGVAV